MTKAGVFKWKQPFHQLRRTLAKFWLKCNSQVTVVGITGSYGKTNTTRAIATVLSEKYRTLQTDLNLDTIYNLPITILKLRPWHQKLVLEYGVDHKNEMNFHLSLVKPTIGVLTGITPVHSDPELLGSLRGIIKEKEKLLEALPQDGLAVLNWDDRNVRQMAKKTKARTFWYGTSTKCDFWAEDIQVAFSGTTFKLKAKEQTKNCLNKKLLQAFNLSTAGLYITTGLIGKHFVHACLAATIVGLAQGLSLGEIKRGLVKLQPLKGRLNIEKGPKGSVLINDALRANPASTIAGLQVLVDLPTSGRRIAVLGEMGELGKLAKKEHRRIGRKVAELGIDYLISVGPLQKHTAEEAVRLGMKKERVFWVENVHQAARILKKILKKGDTFYLKGSLLRHLERIVLILRGKKVGCTTVFCHFYNQCVSCPYVEIGL